MQRWEPYVWAFVGLALVWGFGTAWLAEAAGWDVLAAPGCAILLLAGFGWMRREREFVDVFIPAVVVAYAAFAGLAVWRMLEPGARLEVAGTHPAVALTAMGVWQGSPLWHYWPLAVVGGLGYGLALATFIAVPASWLVRRHLDPAAVAADARFAAFYRDQLAALARPIGSRSDDARPRDAAP